MKNTKDIITRAFKTFLQAFIATLSVSLATTDLTDKVAIRALIIGGLASGISALMNFILNIINKEKK